jgi:NAD(P)H-dependent FMN reductase
MEHPERKPTILLLTLSASAESRSRQCLPTLISELTECGAAPEHVDVRSLPPLWVDDRDLEEFPSPYGDLFARVEAADGVVLILPIYCYTISSPAKALTEVLGDAFSDKPVGFVTAAGSSRSHLAVRDLMASMLFEQATICFPVTVQVTKETLVDGELDGECIERLRVFARDFLLFTTSLRGYCETRASREEE